MRRGSRSSPSSDARSFPTRSPASSATYEGRVLNDFPLDVISADGEERRVEISSVALRGRHRAIGMFGLVTPSKTPRSPTAKRHPRLTARQHEILEHLAEGHSTDQIAAELHLSRETVRNHVRHVLRRVGASSRLEAVAIARRDGIL